MDQITDWLIMLIRAEHGSEGSSSSSSSAVANVKTGTNNGNTAKHQLKPIPTRSMNERKYLTEKQVQLVHVRLFGPRVVECLFPAILVFSEMENDA